MMELINEKENKMTDIIVEFRASEGWSIEVLARIEQALPIREKMDELDKDPKAVVNVIFPDTLLAVGSVFTNALFSDSVKTLGSVEAVLNKYNIIAPGDLKQEIKEKIALLGIQ